MKHVRCDRVLGRNVRSIRPVCCTGENGSLKPGLRVRVVKSIMVYHVPKLKKGFDIEGMEGDLLSDVRQYKGQELTPNFPWKVQFQRTNPEGGKQSKFFVHLVPLAQRLVFLTTSFCF